MPPCAQAVPLTGTIAGPGTPTGEISDQNWDTVWTQIKAQLEVTGPEGLSEEDLVTLYMEKNRGARLINDYNMVLGRATVDFRDPQSVTSRYDTSPCWATCMNMTMLLS